MEYKIGQKVIVVPPAIKNSFIKYSSGESVQWGSEKLSEKPLKIVHIDYDGCLRLENEWMYDPSWVKPFKNLKIYWGKK